MMKTFCRSIQRKRKKNMVKDRNPILPYPRLMKRTLTWPPSVSPRSWTSSKVKDMIKHRNPVKDMIRDRNAILPYLRLLTTGTLLLKSNLLMTIALRS